MQFLTSVGNAFLQKKEQPHFKNFARHWQIIFENRLRSYRLAVLSNFPIHFLCLILLKTKPFNMIYAIPTKKGIGVEIWGTRDDLEYLYEVVSKFWNDEKFFNVKGYEDKNNLISSFSYEIRKASYGSRLIRNSSHYSFEEIPYLGFKISWVHILFSIATLKYNMKMAESNKGEIAMFLHLEYWIERAMESYDSIGAKKLLPYLDNAIYLGNEYLYLYMRNINATFFEMKGGKNSFRKLAELMRTCIYSTEGYKNLLNFLQSEAKKHNCDLEDLELNDDDKIYEIEW